MGTRFSGLSGEIKAQRGRNGVPWCGTPGRHPRRGGSRLRYAGCHSLGSGKQNAHRVYSDHGKEHC